MNDIRLVDITKENWDTVCWLNPGTAPNNRRGKHIYEKYGFKPTGETCGDQEDIEDIYCLEL